MNTPTSPAPISIRARPSRWRPYVDSWPHDAREFGERLRATMQAAGLTQETVRKAGGISDTALRRVLYGRTWATQQTRWGLIRAIESLTAKPAAQPNADHAYLGSRIW